MARDVDETRGAGGADAAGVRDADVRAAGTRSADARDAGVRNVDVRSTGALDTPLRGAGARDVVAGDAVAPRDADAQDTSARDAMVPRDANAQPVVRERGIVASILEKPKNICDYVETQLDTFAERPLCAVDSLVLSWFSNFRLEALGSLLVGRSGGLDGRGVRLQETLRAESFDALLDLWDPPSCKRLLQAMAASPRFRDVRVSDFVMEREGGNTPSPKQFSAVTLLLDDGTTYVAYRGTDATFAGWREDFDMTFARPVPSQAAALAYLTDVVAPEAPGQIVLGGHSKGGNLAVYAAAEAPEALQARIGRVYSHDGPGFDAEFLASGGFGRIKGRIDKTMPQSSVVGMMLETQEDYSVVRSTSTGIFQHNPFSWVVDGCAFEEVEGISAGARHVDGALNAWISGRTPEERDRFTNELFDLLGSTDAASFAEVRDTWQTALPVMAQRVADMDDETRRFMLATLAALGRALLPGA